MSWLKSKILRGDKGIGDTVERLTKITGIKNIVDKVSEFTGKDCGCAKRKKILNEMFSYNSLNTKDKQKLDNLIYMEREKEYLYNEVDVNYNDGMTKLTDDNIDKELKKLNGYIAQAKGKLIGTKYV